MKRLSRTLAALLAATLAGCTYYVDYNSSGTSSNLRAETNVTRTASIPSGIKQLEVDNHFGQVRITGVTNGAAQWTWNLTIHAETDALAEQAAQETHCDAELHGGRLEITVEFPKSRRPHGYQSDFEITVPKDVSVLTKNAFGKTAISDVNGDVEAEGQSGPIELSGIKGKVRAQTSFAPLSASDTGAASLQCQSGTISAHRIHGPLDATTSFAAISASDIDGPVKLRDQSGGIDLDGAKGDADLKTSFAPLKAMSVTGKATLENQSGRVEARDVDGPVRATTSFASMDIESASPSFVCRNQSGSVKVRATSASLASVDAKTSFASMEIRLPKDLSPAVQARTSFGNIESDFPVLMKPRGEDAFAGVPTNVARIALENQSGSIRILKE